VDARDGFALGRFFGTEAQPVDPPVMVLMRTSDGGLTWKTVGAPPEPAEHIAFSTKRLGWAFGPRVQVTRDGGNSWFQERRRGRVEALVAAGLDRTGLTGAHPRMRRGWASVQWLDGRHGWAATGNDVYRTTDAGRHWAAVRLHPAACGCIHRVDGR